MVNIYCDYKVGQCIECNNFIDVLKKGKYKEKLYCLIGGRVEKFNNLVYRVINGNIGRRHII